MSRARFMLVVLWSVALILAGWVLGQLPLSAILQQVRALTAWQWLAWAGLNVTVIALLTRRWQLLAGLFGRTPDFLFLLQARQAGQTVSFLTPGPQFGGEPLQVYWLFKRRGLPMAGEIGGLGLDRFFELWVNFSVLFLGMLYLLANTTGVITNGGDILFVLAALLTLLAGSGWLVLKRPAWIGAGLQKLTSPWRHHPRLGNVEDHWQVLARSLSRVVSTHRPALLRALLLSIGGWIAMLGELWLLLVFLDVPVGMSGFMLIFVATRLAFLLPLPGGVGTLEAAVYWACQSSGFAPAAAIGLIALMRLRDAVIIVTGLLMMRHLNAGNET